VALCQARISTKPLWGFSSSNPYHSQSRAEQQVYFRYEGYSSLSPEEEPGQSHEAHHHQGHDQEHRVAAHHARHILNNNTYFSRVIPWLCRGDKFGKYGDTAMYFCHFLTRSKRVADTFFPTKYISTVELKKEEDGTVYSFYIAFPVFH
jgi:hypothetical protein